MRINKAEFLAWAKTKGNEQYYYFLTSECALSQYLKYKGKKNPIVGGVTFTYGIWELQDYNIPQWLIAPLKAGSFDKLVRQVEGRKI